MGKLLTGFTRPGMMNRYQWQTPRHGRKGKGTMMNAPDQAEAPLHVLIQHDPERGVHVAQCVEYDIAAEGETVEDAKRAFAHTIIRHVLAARQFNRDLFEGVPHPPADVRAAWDKIASAGTQPERLEIPAFTIQRRGDGGKTTAQAPPPRAELLCA